MTSPLFLLLMLGLAVLSAVLAWFALAKVPVPRQPERPDRRGWDVLAVRHDLDGDLSGPVGAWRLAGKVDGLPVTVRVIELGEQRWTEARVRIPGAAGDLAVKSRARGEKLPGAVPVGHPVLDELLLVGGDAGLLRDACQAEERLASWLALLGPAEGPVVLEGWLVRSVDGCDGEAAQRLVDELVAGTRHLVPGDALCVFA